MYHSSHRNPNPPATGTKRMPTHSIIQTLERPFITHSPLTIGDSHVSMPGRPQISRYHARQQDTRSWQDNHTTHPASVVHAWRWWVFRSSKGDVDLSFSKTKLDFWETQFSFQEAPPPSGESRHFIDWQLAQKAKNIYFCAYGWVVASRPDTQVPASHDS
ncbi:hypothetical protein BCR34DRAFT_296651 [Clohesyomyces aquaticus]|uniref:Uncharacterized protein n=1 Tax=Clohesyomyces aquaticus TaxID=1231657 RepID=A0A1Y2A8M1_9PLEO|nr:hypothetical protein BCR34DRAFT_296651 [Clohesyomyces aquaticus]